MFSSTRFLGRSKDLYRLSLGYEVDVPASCMDPQHSCQKIVEFNSSESVQTVVDKVNSTLSTMYSSRSFEYVRVQLQVQSTQDSGLGGERVTVALRSERLTPDLVQIESARISGSAVPETSYHIAVLQQLSTDGVRVLKLNGTANDWPAAVLAYTRHRHLTELHLNGCNLAAIPESMSTLKNLRCLSVNQNRLATLPHEIGLLTVLESLSADNNVLTTLPVELKHCVHLRRLSLQQNRLSTPVMDLQKLMQLSSLLLLNNPLEYLPELIGCISLRELSIGNAVLRADEGFTTWSAEVISSGSALDPLFSRQKDAAGLFALIFRRSSCQHPLVAGALAKMCESSSYREAMMKQQGAMQQLLSMALSDNDIVVAQACRTLSRLAPHLARAEEPVLLSVARAMLALINSPEKAAKLGGLGVVSSLATASHKVAEELQSNDMLAAIHGLLQPDGAHDAPELQVAALAALAHLSFSMRNKAAVLQRSALIATVHALAARRPRHGAADVDRRVWQHAVRVLAVLGQTEAVMRAVGRSWPQNRGLRILSLDGGGMKGLTLVKVLAEIERRTGREIHELFDLICGTSTGAMLAMAIATRMFDSKACRSIYTNLGIKVFASNAPSSGASKVAEPEGGWKEYITRMYDAGSQQMRVAVYGSKHDASTFEKLLQKSCNILEDGCLSNQLIDSVPLAGPLVFGLATLASVTPAEPFVFRNYELPLEAQSKEAQMRAAQGSSTAEVWQAVRASSAAPYYLDDFFIGDMRFQDGSVVANNPTAVAVQQAQLLFPDVPMDCVASIGVGVGPPKPRERSMHTAIDTSMVLMENALSSDRAHEAMAAVLPLLPGCSYFRFQPVDVRCDVDLDEVNTAALQQLEEAVQEYLDANSEQLDTLCRLLSTPAGAGSSAGAGAAGTRIAEKQTCVDAAEAAAEQLLLQPLPGAVRALVVEAVLEGSTACELAELLAGRLGTHSCSIAEAQAPRNSSCGSGCTHAGEHPSSVDPFPFLSEANPASDRAAAAPAAPAASTAHDGSAPAQVRLPDVLSPPVSPGLMQRAASRPGSDRGQSTDTEPAPTSPPRSLSFGAWAWRSGGAAADTGTVPQCRSTAPPEAAKEPEPAAASAVGTVLDALRTMPGLPAVVVLCLESFQATAWAPAAGWSVQHAALSEPGPQADALIRRLPAGCAPAGSLSAALQPAAGVWLADGALLQLQVQHGLRHRGGAELLTHVVRISSPAALLRPDDLARLGRACRSRIALCPSPLSPACRAAFLSDSTGLLVCPSPPSPSGLSAHDPAWACGSFWSRTVEALLADQPLVDALRQLPAHVLPTVQVWYRGRDAHPKPLPLPWLSPPHPIS